MTEQPERRPRIDPAQPSDAPPNDIEPKPSGLRNPAAAVRGVAAGTLVAEGLILLLAIVPLRVLGAHLTGLAITVVVALAVFCVLLAGQLRRPWAWYAGSVVPLILLVAGLIFHPSLLVLGVLFGLGWTYVLSVRRTVLK